MVSGPGEDVPEWMSEFLESGGDPSEDDVDLASDESGEAKR